MIAGIISGKFPAIFAPRCDKAATVHTEVAACPIDSKARSRDACDAMEEDDRPRIFGDAATRLSGESLDSYSQDELEARILLLEAEIARVRSHRLKVAAHMQAADALFQSRTGS